MPVYYEWTSRKKPTLKKHEYPSFEVASHPLKVNVINVMKESTSKILMDNLTKWSNAFEEVDPLLRFEQMKQEEECNQIDIPIDDVTNYKNSWNTRRSVILNKYTTGEKLTIVSSFLPGGEKTLFRQVSNLNEKVKHRLEQLDDFDEGSVRKTMGLSQQEFVTKINMLNDEIKKAWDSEQRVKAFKIGIQCSKLLSDVNVMQFYPSKFVLITDILDTFGVLVFDRLKAKSFKPNEVKDINDIDPREIPETAKETCQNWLFKMASIRELLPRLYMEMSLLKCYAFISKNEIKPVIARLTTMIRGIGNPLVAIYLRLYLCRVASKLLGKESEEFFYSNLKEFLEEYQQIFHPMIIRKFEAQLLTLDKYLNLYVPAVDWLLHGTLNSNKCKDTLLDELLQQCEDMENNELLLYCVVNAFDSPSIIKKSSKILELVQKSSDKMVLVSEILTSLGEHLCNTESHRQLSSEALIQTWWKIATTLKSTFHFLQVLEPWLQFACTHLSTQHVNIILRGTIRYMIKCGKPADEFSGNFHFVIRRMLKFIPDVEELFLMDAFMPLVELVQTANARTMMAKTVLSIFFSRYTSVHIEDHIIISSLMRLCCILHDSINAVTVDDESKVCAELINKFVQAVTYEDDLEQQLNFYVECRSAFIKLDAVLIALVHAVNALAARAGARRLRWLQRACAAYCFVTVPSLPCALARAQLYLLAGQVALLNNCIGQAEANFKALVGLIPDIPEFLLEDGQRKPTNVKVSGIMSDFLSTMLIMPDNVDSNCKAYLLSGFIKMIERIHWKKTDPLYYATLLRILDVLSEMTQENYAYHIDSVLSNDKLYGGEEEFLEAIDKHATNICQELLVVLKMLGDAKETKKQHNLALEMFWRVVRRGELNKATMMSLAANLWMLSQKLQEPSNNKMAKSMLAALASDSSPASQVLLKKLEESATKQ
ncbi:VPS35 endosomal protein-sorting factor-like isoform X2 [Ostrinia nubilalis]|uniref:VPS35 endosomal protein-sorting factor-like isoform X2 n=1 Tax=Ostrinia nubilalis TaxID=29057 RepID=UPI0030823745